MKLSASWRSKTKFMPKIILGLVGEICSGKDTVAAYLKDKYGSETIGFSMPIRDILDRLYLPQTRDNMMRCGIFLRDGFGQDLFSRVIAQETEASNAPVVAIPNVRLESDIVYLDKLPGFVLVGVDAAAELRFERIKQRNQNPDDATKTWEEFQKDAELPTEIHIRELAKKCEFTIDNNGDLEYLHTQIDGLMGKLLDS